MHSVRLDWYACKLISKKQLITSSDVEDIKREIAILHLLSDHPNVINLKGAYEDDSAVYIVMELCTGGELFDQIIARGHYSERAAAEVVRVIVSVVRYCHANYVIHRDLKPENFLVSSEEEGAPLKAVDFGLSAFYRPGMQATPTLSPPPPLAHLVVPLLSPHPPHFPHSNFPLAPTPPARSLLAETNEGIFEEVLWGHVDQSEEPWPQISREAKQLVLSLLQQQPERRPTAAQLMGREEWQQTGLSFPCPQDSPPAALKSLSPCSLSLPPEHPWVREGGVATDTLLAPAVIMRLKRFAAMNRLKRLTLKLIASRVSDAEAMGLREMFKAMDGDGSGTISLAELRDGVERLGDTVPKEQLRQMMAAADVDSSGSIDYNEFLAATMRVSRETREAYLQQAFAHFDTDNNG
ncbi:unnamed protein product [Closterium sp. NIES-54]